jgi:hypothetical protein
MADPVTPAIIKRRYPSLYDRLPKNAANEFINELILEAYKLIDPTIFGDSYSIAVRLYVASNIHKEVNRAAVKTGVSGVITSRTVSGQYSVSYANGNAAKAAPLNHIDNELNEYDLELERLYRLFNVPFMIL